MTDVLTMEALIKVRTALAGCSEGTRAVMLRQVLAVAAGQLCSLEGADHVDRVMVHISGALRRAA